MKMIDLNKYESLIRENERYRSALNAIRSECEKAIMGAWRHRILALIEIAMNKTKNIGDFE
jgi:hypothetical protein